MFAILLSRGDETADVEHVQSSVGARGADAPWSAIDGVISTPFPGSLSCCTA